MRKFLRNILLAINILLALLLVLSGLSVNISPSYSWIFAFFSLSYPFLLLLNIAFIILWIIFRKWYIIIPVVCILIGWNSLKSSFQFNLKKIPGENKSNTVNMLTYNVRLFNYYQWDKDTLSWQKIVDFINAEKPDIVCLQEFVTLPGTNHDLENLKKKLKPLIYSHVYYTDVVHGKINFGLAVFSKYPIIRKKMIEFKESLNGSMSSDVVIGSDTVRLFNCHLQSIRLKKDYNDLLDSLIFNYKEKHFNDLKDISVKMRQAYIQRANQVEIMIQNIRSSPYPVIICGDFNDTPVSYTYHNLSKDLNDAFIESGSGFGTTYRGNFPYARIDYVLYSPFFESIYYNSKKVKWSDHYPVITRFRKKSE